MMEEIFGLHVAPGGRQERGYSESTVVEGEDHCKVQRRFEGNGKDRKNEPPEQLELSMNDMSVYVLQELVGFQPRGRGTKRKGLCIGQLCVWSGWMLG